MVLILSNDKSQLSRKKQLTIKEKKILNLCSKYRNFFFHTKMEETMLSRDLN